MKTDILQGLAMNDNGFIFDPTSGYSYTANETGIMILRAMAQGKEKEEIRDLICSVYEVSNDQFDSDYEHYMLLLEAYNIVSD